MSETNLTLPPLEECAPDDGPLTPEEEKKLEAIERLQKLNSVGQGKVYPLTHSPITHRTIEEAVIYNSPRARRKIETWNELNRELRAKITRAA